jgi:dipeptidyl aminopeptidase/acylaminoacyl peptidase
MTVALIPLDVLLGNPEKVGPQLSPDGEKMAYIAPVNDVLNVWVGDIGKDNYIPVTKDTDRGIRAYFWSFDNRHILYIQDKGGDENWRLYAVDLDARETRDLTPFEGVQVQIVARHKNFPNELLIAMNKDNPQNHDVYHLQIDSGALQLVAKNPGNIVGWTADRELKVRAAQAARPDGGFDALYREDQFSEFETLIAWDPVDALHSAIFGFTGDGKSLFLIDSRNSNTSRFAKLEIATGNIDVLAEDAKYDVSGALQHPDTREIQAVSFSRARNEWLALDDKVAADFEQIKALSRGDFIIVNRDLADRNWLVAFTIDNGPVPYFTYDRETKKATFLFNHRSALEKYALAEMEPFSFIARDGLTIEGYITFPVGVERRNLPMVLNPHGGPWHRDTWGFNPDPQWLANRGYICVQPNFRGSTGFGKYFLNAGNKEWGGKMHDDLIDATHWAINQGYADPKRIAIYGASYGGYAALVGATFTPDVFCCAVDVVGPSNLITFIHAIPPYWEPLRAMLQERIGNPETEEEFLKNRSPLFKVDHIKIPLLIAQGANDPRVQQAESEQIVNAMKQKGIEHEYLLFEDEGHGFAKPENRLTFYRAADRFLAKYLGGRSEA